MPNTDQVVSYVNIWDVLRTPVYHDCDGFAASDLARLSPALADFSSIGNLNQIQFVSTFVEYLPNEAVPNLVQWSSRVVEYPVNGKAVNLVQLSTASAQDEGSFALIQFQPSHPFVEYFPQDGNAILPHPTLVWSISPEGELTTATVTTEPKPRFDFGCNVLATAMDALAAYISESEREARESWNRFYRKHISSSAVSKDGHLSFLVPSYREVCVKTAARDHVVHLEVITLAEEQEAPGTSAVGQMLNASGESWKRWRNRLSNLFSRFLRKTLPGGFTAGGLGFASVEPLLQY
jgi:hypothetical protein